MTPATTDSGMNRLGWGLHAAGLGITIALIAATDALVLDSIRQREAQLGQEVEAATEYLERSDEIRHDADRLRSQLADDESRLIEVTARIPDDPRESEFLEQVTRLARSAGVRICEYDPSDAFSDGTHSAMEIHLETRASYDSICRFLDGLEYLPRLCRVTQLRITGPQDDTGMHPVSLTLRIYYTSLHKLEEEAA